MADIIVTEDKLGEACNAIKRFFKNHKHILTTHDYRNDEKSFVNYKLEAYSNSTAEIATDNEKRFIRIALPHIDGNTRHMVAYIGSMIITGNDYIIIRNPSPVSSHEYVYHLIQEDYTYFDEIGYDDPKNPPPKGINEISKADSNWAVGDVLAGMDFYSVLNNNIHAAYYLKYFKLSKSSNPFIARFGTYACRYLSVESKYSKIDELDKRWITMWFNTKLRIDQTKPMDVSVNHDHKDNFAVYMGRNRIIINEQQEIFDMLGLMDELWDNSDLVQIYKIDFDLRQFVKLRSHKPHYAWPGVHRVFGPPGSSIDFEGKLNDT